MAASTSNAEQADRLIKRFDALKGGRNQWDAFWQDVGNYVMPRKANITSYTHSPGTQKEQQLFDNTAVRSNQILANGQLAWMTPHESPWFSFDAPAELQGNDEVEQWFAKCTEVAQAALAQSNFYSEIHELYLDRGAFGTATIYCEPGRRAPLRFEALPIGSYCIAEDDEGLVDTCHRELELTLRQAVQMFGIDQVSEPMRKAYHSGDPVKLDERHRFLHAIYPREPESIDPSKMDPENMPIASVYIDIANKHVCREAGYKETPFMATRYLKWGREVYGWSPSWIALPEARQLNFLEMQMDALAELAAFPRMLIPSTHEGDIDFRAHGITYYDASNPNAIPREWATGGRYDVGEARAEVRRKAIEDSFHVDLFKMFAQLQKQMTAREVAERSSEKLIQFSPTFARMTTELFNPLLARVFNTLLRAGAFPQPPESALVQDASGVYLPSPKVSYRSRIALAIKSLENAAFSRAMETILPLSNIRPDILDNYDFDKIARNMSRNDGVSADWMLDKAQVDEIRAARAQAQAQQMQMEQAEQMANAAAKAGSVKPDSMLGQAVADAM